MLANPQTTVTKKTKKKEGNAVKNADALLKKKFVEIKIEDQNLKAHLGEPQLGNSHWFIFGDSGEGKTSYTLAVVKELTKNYKVLYNTLEEGDKKSFQNAIRRTGLKGNKNFLYIQANYEQIIEQLLKEKQPKIVVIDSAQYLFRGKQVQHYANLVNKFKNTTFIWISGADGTKLKGKIADDIRYDCDIVIFVKDFKAEIKKNRFEANASYIVWEEGYKQTLLK